MDSRDISIISNRMKTLLDLYSRENSIQVLSDKTGLSYNQVQKVLSDNNYYHGIKRNEGSDSHPNKAILFYEDYKYLLDCDILDTLR